MSFSSSVEAIAALSSVNANQADIINFVRQLSISAPGSVTVLYSGLVGDTPAFKFVNDMGSDVRHIGKTMAYEVLNSEAFNTKVAKAFGYATLDEFVNDPRGKSSPANVWLNKGGTGPWATASEMFVNGTTTPIRFLAIDPLADSVLVKNEWSAALERLRSGQIPSLEGLSAAELQGLTPSQALEKMKAKSALHIGMSGLKATPDGLRSIGDFLNTQILDEASYAKNNPAAMQKLVEYLNGTSLTSVSKTTLRAAGKTLGTAGAILVLGLALTNSAQAAEAGDPDKARKIMEAWALEALGGAAGGAAGAAFGTTVMGIAAAAAVTTGAVISAPVLAGLLVGAAVFGGIAGSVVGSDVLTAGWEKYRGDTDNSELNFLEQLLAKVALPEYGLVFGTKNSDNLTGTAKADYVFGGACDDTLTGLAGNDVLRGGAGNDTLDGGTGNDMLIGGAGADTYKFSENFGLDTVDDVDGNGVIELDGNPLDGGNKIGKGIWQNAAKTVIYTFEPGADGKGTLQITRKGEVGNTIRVLNWQNNQMGIVLNETAAVPEQPNNVPTELSDKLQGTALMDAIDGKGGDDQIFGSGGDDILAGGAGSDSIDGGDGNDVILSAGAVLSTTPLENPTNLIPTGATIISKGNTWARYTTHAPNNFIPGSNNGVRSCKIAFNAIITVWQDLYALN